MAPLGWKVSDCNYICNITFDKINMFLDLEKNRMKVISHPNVRQIAFGKSDYGESDDYDYDDHDDFDDGRERFHHGGGGGGGSGGDSSSVSISGLLESGRNGPPKSIEDMETVFDCDSSQMNAIRKASEGVNFVLNGPPGTGKSQTIANIIANCIYTGKSVLFVTEKQTAVQVVYDKLKKKKLDEFCLFAHNEKANKAEIGKSLYNDLLKKDVEVDRNADKLNIERYRMCEGKLDEYQNELHRKRDVIGFSLFELIGKYLESDGEIRTWFVRDLEGKGMDWLEDAKNALRDYLHAFVSKSLNNDYAQDVFYSFNPGNLNLMAKNKLKEDAKRILDYIENSSQARRYFAQLKQFAPDGQNMGGRPITDLFAGTTWSLGTMVNVTGDFMPATAKRTIYPLADDILDFLQMLERNPYLQGSLINAQNLKSLINFCSTWLDEYDKFMMTKNLIANSYDNSIYNICKPERRSIIENQEGKGLKLFANKDFVQLQKEVAEARLDKSTRNEPQQAFELVEKCVEQHDWLKRTLEQNQGRFPPSLPFSGPREKKQKTLDELRKILAKVASTSASFDFSRRKREEFQRHLNNMKLAVAYIKALPVDSIGRVFRHFPADVANRLLGDEKLAVDFLKRICEGSENFDTWQKTRSIDARMREHDLMDLVNTFTDEDWDEIREASHVNDYGIMGKHLDKVFYYQWAESIIGKVPALAQFDEFDHESILKEFRRMDMEITEHAATKIINAARRRKPHVPERNIPQGIKDLKKIANLKRGKPMRVILRSIGDTALKIKPCFMMSPKSVASSLPADLKFDLVIFDEASQMLPSDAMGSIFRAKQIIVAGDPKQMPPSNMFNKTFDEEDEDDGDDFGLYDAEEAPQPEKIEDYSNKFESLLDICKSILPEYMLKWHYRSKDESLIAFSNHHFYNGALLTFPQPNTKGSGDPDEGVSFIKIENGVFYSKNEGEFGGGNPEEAKKIVELMAQRILEHPEKSLGVVVMNKKQSEIVDDLVDDIFFKMGLYEIDEATGKTPMDVYDSFNKDAPVFIKNLETVQGDERDTIILGVTYAPNKNGTFYSRFGPINAPGGERRINVAVTRAKSNMIVVSSVSHTDFKYTSENKGASIFRKYVKYSETGILKDVDDAKAILTDERSGNFGEQDFDSPFEEDVYAFLVANGFNVDTQVGESRYRIDMALKDDEGRYYLGIECDGAAYHGSASARDRDRLRQEILEEKGWRFYRIWSTDWFNNTEDSKDRLLRKVSQARDEFISTGNVRCVKTIQEMSQMSN